MIWGAIFYCIGNYKIFTYNSSAIKIDAVRITTYYRYRKIGILVISLKERGAATLVRKIY